VLRLIRRKVRAVSAGALHFGRKTLDSAYRSVIYSLDEYLYWVTQGRRLKVLRNTCIGQRCFIIGNGRSLKMHDLTKLVHEKKFATNLFPLHPDLEKIHLDYYCASDPRNWTVGGGFPSALRAGFAKLSDCLFFFWRPAAQVVRRTPELRRRNVYYLNFDLRNWVYKGVFSTDVSRRVFCGHTVIIDFCLPLAFYFGFKEIYLLGCDCDYQVDQAPDYSQAYFYDKSLDERSIYYNPRDPIYKRKGDSDHVAVMLASYAVVKKAFEANGRKIYNAGYGGALEVFERVNYVDLF